VDKALPDGVQISAGQPRSRLQFGYYPTEHPAVWVLPY